MFICLRLKKAAKVFLLLLAGLFLAWLAGCSTGAGGDGAGDRSAGGRASLWVTRDFGAAEITLIEVNFRETDSVMNLLQQNLEVETEYGGGFVNAIEGLKSGYTGKGGDEQRMLDWFFYINGILSGVGALDYLPGDGDVIWWDYHPWGEISFTPAVIGTFPQPFLNGYRGSNSGTLILSGEGCSESSEYLAAFLRENGVKQVEVLPYEETQAQNRSRMTIVVAPWNQLSGSNFWKGLQKNRDKSGWFAELASDAFYPLDMYGQRGERAGGSAGALLATGTGMGDAAPLWLFTSLDKEGICKIVELVIQRPEKLRSKIGALVVDKEVIALPLQQ